MVSLSWKGAGKFKWQNNSEKRRNILSFWSYQFSAFVCALLSQSTFSWQKKRIVHVLSGKKSLGQILKSWSWWWYMIFMMIVAQYSLKRYTLVEIDSIGGPRFTQISLKRLFKTSQIYVHNANSFTYTYIKCIHTYFSHYVKLTSGQFWSG